jgi:hypothetical protein
MSTTEIEMDYLSDLDTTFWTDCLSDLDTACFHVLGDGNKLGRVGALEDLTFTVHHLLLSDAPHKQRGPDSFFGTPSKVVDEAYKLASAILWLTGKIPTVVLRVVHRYLSSSNLTPAISSSIAYHIAGEKAPDVQQWICAALMKNSLSATESLWTLWYNQTLKSLSEKVSCAVFVALTFLRNGSDECEEETNTSNMSHLLSEIGAHGSDVRVRKLAVHQSDTHTEKLAMEAQSVSSAREAEA